MKKKTIRDRLSFFKNAIIEKTRHFLSFFRRGKIKRDFCIISNNCWAGKVYQRYGRQYNTPTVGLYFFADDYLRFLSDLKRYICIPMTIIETKDSCHFDSLAKMGQNDVIVGKIDDVEIVFLHYSKPAEAIEKWERRKKRIDWDNLIIKFSRMNECNDEHIQMFDNLDFDTKFVFVNKKNLGFKSSIYINGYDDQDNITDDTTHYNSYLNLEKMINDRIIVPKKGNL